MKHLRALVVLGLMGAVALVTSLSLAAAGSAGTKERQALTAATIKAPRVPNAAAIRKKYGGQSIKWISDGRVGSSLKRDQMLVKRFTRDTGIKVKAVPHDADSSAAYAQLARNFTAHSSSIDVMMLDVVWPGAFAPYLIDLKKPLGKQAKLHAKGIIANNTVGGHLVAMPWFGDFGILYYRTDLLKKYGYSGPPKTWAQLETMAKKIQAGERKNDSNFYGFVWQGKAYEGLTCDALEWVASSGGGNFIDNGKASINNKNAVDILNMVRRWVGTIAPNGVTSYQEEDARIPFDTGHAAFMRNWPYAYSIGQQSGSPVKGKFSVAVLPHSGNNPSVGTVGGWQLGVSKYSKHKGAAIELVRYLSSPAVEKFDAIYNSNVPTIPKVALLASVRKVNPWLKPAIANVARATRPSKYLKAKYQQGSTYIFQAMAKIESGSNAKTVLPGLAQQLNRLLG